MFIHMKYCIRKIHLSSRSAKPLSCILTFILNVMTWFSLFACYFSKVIFFIIFTPCCLSCFDQCSQWHVFCRRKRCLCTILHEKLTMFWVFFSHSKNITNSFTSLFLFLIKMSRKRGKDLILEVHFWFLKPSLIILYCWHLLHRFPDCSSLCPNTSTFIAQFKFYEDSSENPKLQNEWLPRKLHPIQIWA